MASLAHDVIVIGAGITGLTASKRLLEAGASVANVEGGLFGGLVTNVNELDGPYEGSGADLASTLMMEVTDLGAASVAETVTALDGDGELVTVATDGGIHHARAVIVASGATLKALGVPGEAELAYKGVSQCADCDGPMFAGEHVVVVGGGDSALQEACVLSRYCGRVTVVHRGAAFTAHPRWVSALQACANVTVATRSVVTAIEGTERVEGVRLEALDDGRDALLACAGVFAYVGLAPAAAFMPERVERDAQGALVTDDALETAVRNVFAAGAVRAGYGGTLADAVHDAETAVRGVLARLRTGAMS